MAGGRTAKVTKQAAGTKSRSTLRAKSTVRLVEVLYPLPEDPKTGPPFWREIEDKWVYIFHQPGMSGSAKLVDELFADTRSDNWIRMLEPGNGKNREDHNTSASYPYGKGYVGVTDERGQYAYYLSPIQLSPKAVQQLHKQIEAIPAKGDRWSQSHLAVNAISDDGSKFSYYLSSEFAAVDKPVSLHSYSQRHAKYLYLVFVLDIFAWTEDIHAMGYQGALDFIDKYRPGARMRAMIAQVFAGLIKVDKDVLDLANEFPDVSPFWNAQGRSTPQQFYLRREHLEDSRRRISYTQKVDSGKWSNLPSSVQNVPELEVKMYEAQDEALKEMADHFSQELAKWADSNRHKIAETGSSEMQGVALQLGVIHHAKITLRTSETASGKKLLARMYQESGRLMHELLEKKEGDEGAGGVWEKYAPLREVPLSMFKLLENCLGAIAVIDDDKFDHVVKSVLGTKYFGFKWVAPSEKDLPKLWGKTIITSMKKPMLDVPDKSVLAKLADKKELLERYHIKPWFERAELTFKTINLCLTLYKVMSKKSSGAEKAKAALDTISFSASVDKLRLDLKNKELVKFGVMSEEEATKFKPVGFSKGLAKIGEVAGVVTGFVDFYLTADAFSKSWWIDQNYAVAAVQVASGLAAFVGITTGVFALIWGEAVSGPVGWIALALTLVGLLIAFLVQKFKRNKFEEVANYSFLGRQHVRGRALFAEEGSSYVECLYGQRNAFTKSLPTQWRAITALLSTFKIDAGYADALYGKVTLTPGWVQSSTVFRFKWQFQFAEVKGYDKIVAPQREVLIEIVLKASDLTYTSSVRDYGFTGTEVYVVLHSLVELEEREDDDDIPNAKSITLEPKLNFYSPEGPRLDPTITTFMAQADILGDSTILLPFNDDDSKFEVPNGLLAGTYKGWLGYRATALADEAHEAVPVGL